MRTIWKFTLKLDGQQCIEVPRTFKVLSVGVQNRTPCLWIEVDPKVGKFRLPVYIWGTGIEFEPRADMVISAEFIGTFQIDWFVGHVYTIKNCE